jgi:Flp pilus assembly protein TadD
MNEPKVASERSTQTLKLIQSSPLDPASWQGLADKVKSQNDPLSIKSLEIIIEGLKRLEENYLKGEEGGGPPPLSSLSQSMFVRLAKAYNSPTLLKEVGLIYLRDLRMPGVALQHFERALRLGGPEKELRPLTEAAAVAAQVQIAQVEGHGHAHSGIETAKHARPIVPSVIRKTGKMVMPSRFTQTAETKLTATVELESEVGLPLPATTDECLKEADEAIKKGQLRRAAALLEKANKTPADSAAMWQAWTNLGQSFYETSQHVHAEVAFGEALKYDPNEMASHFNVAVGQHLNGKYEDALKSYLKANQLEPNHPKVWCNLGVLNFQTDKYGEAESALRHAVQADPKYARAWDNLAAALGAQDKLDEAIEACQRALELRPDYPESFFKLGVIYFSQNELTKAAEEFRRAASLPILAGYSDAFLAMIHARLEQTEEAEAAVQRAVKADPKCDLIWMAWNDLGLAWYTAGNYQRSAIAYGEATMIKPDEAEAWFNLGVSYHKAGDLKSARASYQQAVDLKESMAGAWHNLGIVCAQNGDHEAAMSAFKREVNCSPENVRAWYDLAVTLEKLGRMDEAKIAHAKVEALTPKPPSAFDTAVDKPQAEEKSAVDRNRRTEPLKPLPEIQKTIKMP